MPWEDIVAHEVYPMSIVAFFNQEEEIIIFAMGEIEIGIAPGASRDLPYFEEGITVGARFGERVMWNAIFQTGFLQWREIGGKDTERIRERKAREPERGSRDLMYGGEPAAEEEWDMWLGYCGWGNEGRGRDRTMCYGGELAADDEWICGSGIVAE